MHMAQLLYVSSYVDGYGFELPQFIESIATSYAARDVRAMTLFANGNIMQLLEGRQSALREIFGNLHHDSKQFGVFELMNTPIGSHCLSETSIGYSSHETRLIKKSPGNISIFRLTPDEIERRVIESPCKSALLQFASEHH